MAWQSGRVANLDAGAMQQYSTLLLIVAMIALFYFLILRPQKKRQQKMRETLDALTPGTDVLLASGVLGTIVEIGERQAVIEVSPGVQMTVLKQAISRVTTEQDLEPAAADDATFDEDDDAGETPDSDNAPEGDLSSGAGFTVPDDASSLTGETPATRRTDGNPDAAYGSTQQGTEPDTSDLPETDRPNYDRPTFERPSFDRPDFAAGEEDPNGPSDPKKD